MSPEAENKLFEDIGSIKAGVENLNDKLAEHMISDRDNFKALGDRLEGLGSKIDTLESNEIAAIKESLAEQKGAAKTKATMLGIAGGIASFVGIQGLKKLLGL